MASLSAFSGVCMARGRARVYNLKFGNVAKLGMAKGHLRSDGAPAVGNAINPIPNFATLSKM